MKKLEIEDVYKKFEKAKLRAETAKSRYEETEKISDNEYRKFLATNMQEPFVIADKANWDAVNKYHKLDRIKYKIFNKFTELAYEKIYETAISAGLNNYCAAKYAAECMTWVRNTDNLKRAVNIDNINLIQQGDKK